MVIAPEIVRAIWNRFAKEGWIYPMAFPDGSAEGVDICGGPSGGHVLRSDRRVFEWDLGPQLDPRFLICRGATGSVGGRLSNKRLRVGISQTTHPSDDGKLDKMPELSRFFGIVIRMFVEAGGQHHRAHFHAFYQEHAAVFAIDTVECLGGDLPKPQRRLVEAWAEIHREELERDWDLLQSGQPPVKIEPLR